MIIKRRSRVSAKPRAAPRSTGIRGDTFDAGVVYETKNKSASSPRVADHVEDETAFDI